jgi:lauroyl/myristoyl acyltransferase
VELSRIGQRSAAIRASLESRICAQLHDGKNYLRPLLRILKGNGVVFTACDGTGGGEELGRREIATVLGRPMLLPVFPLWLGLKTGAPVLTLIPSRNRGPGAPYLAEFGPPLTLGGVRDKGAMDAALAALAERLERALRTHPGDWHFWDALHAGAGGLLSGGTT